MYKRINLKFLTLLAPALLFFVVFIVVPLFYALYISFFKWDGISKPIWVGLGNWFSELTSSGLYHSLLLTFILMILSWIVQTPISLAIGLFLSRDGKWRAILGVFYFTPLLFSAVALGITWSYVLNPNFGLVQGIVQALGLHMSTNLLGSSSTALYTLIAIIAWEFIPFHSLLYQSGAKAIPETLYEAATLDGASGYQTLVYITIPQLKNTLVTSTVVMLTGSLTYFDIIYVLTNGGPAGATNVLALNMYQHAFQEYQMGIGSTVAVILAICGLLLSLALVKWTGFSKMDSQAEGA